MMLCVSIQAPFHVVHWRTAIFTVCFVKSWATKKHLTLF